MEWFIQIHRQMLEWERYDDINTKVLFIHLLIKANWKDKKWRWINIKRWEFLTSLNSLAFETWLSVQKIRSCLDKLEITHEITKESHTTYTIIKLNKYNDYQQNNTQDNKPITNEQQTNNKRVTTTNKDNKDNKERKNKYWEYKNILLTLSQNNKLIKDFWEAIYLKYIKILDEWIQMKGYKYKDHNLVMRKWIAKDTWKTEQTEPVSEYKKAKAERLARYWIVDDWF